MEGYSRIPLIIGSEADLIPLEERPHPELTHQWRIYVKVQPSTISSVQFRLHSSFANPVLVVTEAPFEIKECGWGEFVVQVRITLFNGEKVNTSHYLSLHSDKYPNISERYDAIMYKGKSIEIEEAYNYTCKETENEKNKLLKAIDYVIEQCEKVKENEF